LKNPYDARTLTVSKYSKSTLLMTWKSI